MHERLSHVNSRDGFMERGRGDDGEEVNEGMKNGLNRGEEEEEGESAAESLISDKDRRGAEDESISTQDGPRIDRFIGRCSN